jgi:hypothetical protein
LSRKSWGWDADERLSNAEFPGKKEKCRLGVKMGITTKELKKSAVFVICYLEMLKKRKMCAYAKKFLQSVKR